MKKLLIIGIIVAIAVFFSIPTFMFAETGDEYQVVPADDGQYQMDITDPADGNNTADTDVYCIDDNTLASNDDYTETDTYVGEVLQDEGGNGGTGEDPIDANAVEILAMTATGATDSLTQYADSINQDAVWDIIEDDTPPAGSTVEAIVNATVALSTQLENEYGVLGTDGLGTPVTHDDIVQFLDDENVNELEVALDTDTLVEEDPLDPNYGDYNELIATAIMENPLVPEVTDANKTVSWYILEGSYNVSFAPDSLVTEITSIMNDAEDTTAADIDTDGNPAATDGNSATEDHYGIATQQYYFFWWGAGYAEFEEMNVNLFAWVDIDGDSKLDITDMPGDALLVPGDPGYKDGPVVKDFMDFYQVVDASDVTKTKPVLEASDMDICEREGGKVLAVAEDNDECTSGHWEGGWHWISIFQWWERFWHCDDNETHSCYHHMSGVDYQRFVIENYSEPTASAEALYSAWGRVDLYKGDSTDPTVIPVANATYWLEYIDGQDYAPETTKYVLTTDSKGMAFQDGLPWGKWSLTEQLPTPPGYGLDTETHIYLVGGTALNVKLETKGAVINVKADVVNVPTPGPGPGPGPTPTPLLTVAALTTGGELSVAAITSGIQTLAFTGIDPIIPISGFSVFAGGLGLFIASLLKRNKKK